MQKLFDSQLKLDDIILTNLINRNGINITHRQLADKRMLAAYVELGEFLEEENHRKKLFEAIDLLHFLLSSGLALEIDCCVSKHDINTLYAQAVEKNYYDAVNNFIVKFSRFCNSTRVQKYWSIKRDFNTMNVEKQYYKCFLAFFDLCKSMGYTIADIRQVYSEKWSINVERQKSNY